MKPARVGLIVNWLWCLLMLSPVATTAQDLATSKPILDVNQFESLAQVVLHRARLQPDKGIRPA